jgi:HKD family nuclease
MITSANINQDSFPNSNTALVVEDERVAADVYKSEQAVAHMSDAQLQPCRSGETDRKRQTVKSSHAVQVLTERAIEKRCLHLLQKAQSGDIVYLYTLFIHHKRIEQEIIRASERGAKIRIVLDPNAKLFSSDNPIRLPNSYIARTMERYPNIEIRIYNAADGQFHTKLYTFYIGSDTYVLQGSANLVRMNLSDFNLDSMFFVHAEKPSDFTQSIDEYVSSIWNNTKHQYTYGNKLKAYYDGITKYFHHIQRLTKVGV